MMEFLLYKLKQYVSIRTFSLKYIETISQCLTNKGIHFDEG